MLVGHVFKLIAEAAFLPVFLGNTTFSSGEYTALAGVTVTADFLLERYIPPKPAPKPGYKGFPGGWAITHWGTHATTEKDGTFSLSEPPSSLIKKDGAVKAVSLQVVSGYPIYRTNPFPLPKPNTDLDIFIFPVPKPQGMTAGDVSSQIGGLGLPGDTTITVGTPNGVNFHGSSDGVTIDFNLVVTPDTTSNIYAFVDVDLNGWNINVDFPASLTTDANTILYQLQDAIMTTGNTAVNQGILAVMENSLAGEATPNQAAAFFTEDVSVTLANIGYPARYSFGIGAKTDTTVIMQANAWIGFPRHF